MEYGELRSHCVGIAKDLADLRNQIAEVVVVCRGESSDCGTPVIGWPHIVATERFESIAHGFEQRDAERQFRVFHERGGDSLELFGGDGPAGDERRDQRKFAAGCQRQSTRRI